MQPLVLPSKNASMCGSRPMKTRLIVSLNTDRRTAKPPGPYATPADSKWR